METPFSFFLRARSHGFLAVSSASFANALGLSLRKRFLDRNNYPYFKLVSGAARHVRKVIPNNWPPRIRGIRLLITLAGTGLARSVPVTTAAESVVPPPRALDLLARILQRTEPTQVQVFIPIITVL